MSQQIIPDIVTQHAEEAAFLWLLRDAAVGAPHYDLDDLADLDERVEAHIDGLRVAGEAGWELCVEALAFEEPGELFAAGVLAFEGDDPGRVDAVFEAAAAAPDAFRGIASALGWVEWEQGWIHVERMLADARPERRRAGIAACALWRADPEEPLAAAVADGDAALRARAFRAAGELGRVDLLAALGPGFGDEDDRCRFHAAAAATLLGERAAIAPLAAFAVPDGAFAERAVALAARAMPAADAMAWLRDLAGDPACMRLAAIGAGAVGDPSYVPWLVELMAAPELARPAGEAFSMITGADLAYEDLDGDLPEGFEPGPGDDPADDDVAMDSDEDLPMPDAERIMAWWTGNQGRFQAGTRYLMGAPVAPDHCRHVLVAGYQRQRIAAALELALAEPAQHLFETRAPGIRQKRMLGVTGRAVIR